MPNTPPHALVTGAGRRLGAAIARTLAEDGARLAIHHGRSHRQAEALCREIIDQGGHAVPLQADLADLEIADQLIPRAAEALGGAVTILINSAAIFQRGTLRDTSTENWNRHLAINLSAPTRLMGAFARQFAPDSAPGAIQGRIINIIDQRIRHPRPGHLAYSVAKSGLWSATQMAAAELAPAIQVNAIGPGPILPAPGDDPATFQAIGRATPMQRPGSPADICAAVRFLLSQDFISGEMLCVDGGEHLL